MKATIEDIKYIRHALTQVGEYLHANLLDDIDRMASDEIVSNIVDTKLVALLEIAEGNGVD